LDNDLTIFSLDFDALEAVYLNNDGSLDWNLVFTLPAWLRTWWHSFNNGATLFIRAVRREDRLIGIAPLQIRDSTAYIIGNVDVCDYQDCIVAPGEEADFYQALLDDLFERGINHLHLETIRPDSTIAIHLKSLAEAQGCHVEYRRSDVSADMPLPAAWEDYLAALNGKQRHELRRKLRNLQEAGEVRYSCAEHKADIRLAAERFLQLFPEARNDKAVFMTPEMGRFFLELTESLSETGVVRFGTLELDGRPAAMVMYFDYRGNFYLYNSAYDPAYRALSVGIVSKAECIRDGLAKGRKRFDFLKGAETYKGHLGGSLIPLYSLQIDAPGAI
jgi:CelD/BcsL family acetyltransferase involved in cellulose biosynthesis